MLLSFAHAKDFAAAGCIIQVDDEILMVQDIWSKKWSLPGGMRNSGESLEDNAKREVWEETGLNVEILGEFAEVKRFKIFWCRSLDSIQTIERPYPFKMPYLFRQLRLTKQARSEIQRVALINPNKLPAVELRFPNNRDDFLFRVFEKNVQSPVTKAIDLPTSSWRELELSWVHNFQERSAILKDRFWKFFNFLGEPLLLYFLIVFLAFRFSPRFSILMIFHILVCLLFNEIFKDYFAILRPFEYASNLQKLSASGYSFPSGHTQLAAAFWFYMLFIFRSRIFRLTAVLIVLFCGLARIHYGVHYFSDIFASMLFAFLMAYLMHRWNKNWDWRQAASRKFLLVYSMLLLAFFLFRFHPTTTSILCLLFSVAASAFFLPKESLELDTLSTGKSILAGLLVSSFLFLYFSLMSLIEPVHKTFLANFSYLVLFYLILGFIICLTPVWILYRIKRKI